MMIWAWALVAPMVLAAVVLSLYERAVIRSYRKMSSRFPMFAARDALVHLVADGKMRESDVAWSYAYEACNSFLDMEERLDVHDFLSRMTRHNARLSEDPELARAAELIRRKLRRASRDCEDFGLALARMETALFYMIRERTSATGWVWLKAQVYSKVIWWALSERLHGSRGAVSRSIAALKKLFSSQNQPDATTFVLASRPC